MRSFCNHSALSSFCRVRYVHQASFEKMRAFRSAYPSESERFPLRVLDVGSGSNEALLSYRDLFGPPDFEYVGLDISPGYNVDIVPDDPFSWTTIERESFDIVVSGQTFEHNPYFWITAAEIARVLVPGGLVVVIAPSTGRVHRYPFDCWRFYPDSWSALCAYVGLDLQESSVERSSWRKLLAGVDQWHDSMMVARKPRIADDAARTAYYDRLDAIVATRTETPVPGLIENKPGPATNIYESRSNLPLKTAAYRRPLKAFQLALARRIRSFAPSQADRIRQRVLTDARRIAQERAEESNLSPDVR